MIGRDIVFVTPLSNFEKAWQRSLIDPFTILTLHNPSIDISDVHKVRRSTGFEGLKF